MYDKVCKSSQVRWIWVEINRKSQISLKNAFFTDEGHFLSYKVTSFCQFSYMEKKKYTFYRESNWGISWIFIKVVSLLYLEHSQSMQYFAHQFLSQLTKC